MSDFYPTEIKVTVHLGQQNGQIQVSTSPPCEIASQMLCQTLFDGEEMCLTELGKKIFELLEDNHEASVRVYWEQMEISKDQTFYLAKVEPLSNGDKNQLTVLTQLGANSLLLIKLAIDWMRTFRLTALDQAYRETISNRQGQIRPVAISRWPNTIQVLGDSEEKEEVEFHIDSEISIEEEPTHITVTVSEYPDKLPFHDWANNKIAKVIRDRLAIINTELATSEDLS